ncbi:helix-turn-helix domain-containing protein [Paenibacillus sp. CAU 1782]
MQGGYRAEGELYDDLNRMVFKLRSVSGSEPGSSDWGLRVQFLHCHTLLFVPSGQGWITVDGKFIEVTAGGIYVGFPGQYVEASLHSLDERGLYWMAFDVLEEKGMNTEGLQVDHTSSRFPSKSELISDSPVSLALLCKNMEQQWAKGTSLQRFGAQVAFHELLYRILEQESTARDRHSNSDESLEHVKEYLERNYGEKITIDDLAKVARMSPRHFMRLFKKRYGYSAMNYLTVHRIKKAQMLMLQGGNYSLKDIARNVGYQDDMYFRRKFRQLSGIPPAAFMRNCRRKIVAYHASAIGSLLALKVIPYAAPESHPWADYYRRKYETDNVLSLSLDESERLEQLRMAGGRPGFGGREEAASRNRAALHNSTDDNRLAKPVQICGS